LKVRIEHIEEAYNETYHRWTPMEAWEGQATSPMMRIAEQENMQKGLEKDIESNLIRFK
jgi:hypothetical protein